ncbi:MAG: tRNA (uridine(54)-C5)-methyltransferase TrmA, partial [Pseudomonadales bacterium]
MKNIYKQQLQEKTARISRQFADFLGDMTLAIFESPTEHFRQRAEFRLWHVRRNDGTNTGESFYAMFEAGKKASPQTLKRTDQLPIADKRINELMPKLLACLQSQPVLIERLFQVEFLSTLRGEILVTLIYHKTLGDDWEAVAKPLETQLGIHLIGRSRKQKIILSQDYVTETLNVQGRAFTYRQIEGGFT